MMFDRHLPLVALATVSIAVAAWSPPAAAAGQPANEPAGSAVELLADPARLLQLAESELAAGNHEAAYRWAMLLHVLHPESELDRKAFAVARVAFMPPYNRERLTREGTRWTGHERRLMYAWIRDRMKCADMAAEDFNLFFTGMHSGYLFDFLGSREREQVVDGWRLAIGLDNGRVQNITAGRLQPDPLPR